MTDGDAHEEDPAADVPVPPSSPDSGTDDERMCGRCGGKNPADVEFCHTCGAYLAWDGGGASSAHPGDDAGTRQPFADYPHTPEEPGAADTPHGTLTQVTTVSPNLLDQWLDDTDFPPPVPPSAHEPQMLTVRGYTDEESSPSWTARCRNCERLNPPDRFFCRVCAYPMARSGPRRRPSWMRRSLTRAGDAVYRWWERGRLGRRVRVLSTVVVVVVLAGLLVRAHPERRARTAFADRTAARMQIRPGAVEASGSAPGQGPELAVDGATNTFWSPPVNTPPWGEYLRFTLSQPVRLVGVVVHSGASQDPTGFVKQARPATGVFELTSASGHRRSIPFALADRPGAQSLNVVGADVVAVRMTITSAYGYRPEALTAVAEVEFYRRAG